MRVSRIRSAALVVSMLVSLAGLGACSDDEPGVPGDDPDEVPADDEWGMEGPLEPVPPPGKDDSQHRRGLLVNTDTTRTQVWTARNRWEDTTTAAARKAGLAWGADSGLTWDAKYGRWLESLRWIDSTAGWYQTVELTTPWGKTLPSPSLECAELSLFLRVTFAAWYELPLFFETQDSQGRRVYFGHNGVRTAAGRYASSPEFAIAYRDHSTMTPAAYGAAWPSDARLRARRVAGGEDVQDMLGQGATFGAYLDEIHLNKRAAYFTIMVLDYLGSANLADPANAYNLVPEAVRPGDFLIERWQRSGIGHTLVVKEVVALGEASLDVTTISGSMPRRQGKREAGVASKGYFTSAYAGGPGVNAAGHEYARMGGGLKRWRVTKNVGGYWTNTWMAGDEARWIDSTDYPRIAARPGRFDLLLGQVSPTQLRAELVAQIEDARRHLSSYPASCSARERRERAFEDLYDLAERSFGQDRAEIDAQHRILDDYVLAELDYTRSKTCCWNSTTATMYQVIMDAARDELAAAAAAGTCAAPTVFMARADGYQRWATHAAELGQAAAWRPWSEDESCAQRGVPADTEALHAGSPWCELEADGGGDDGGSCTDALEANDRRGAARSVGAGRVGGLRICAGDEDWFAVSGARTVRVELRHADGDLDLEAYDGTGFRVASSASTTDVEQVTVPAGGTVRVFGYGGATNSYALVVE